ncbi:hypothetical protein TNCV_3520571 [Trichonephila clavipes]|nr:hypothetical protein TNCV_3520571 [Trichonephila clavipes]
MQTVLIGGVPKILRRMPPMARVPVVRHPCSRETSCWPPTLPQKTLQELERALLEEWDRIPQLVINSLIDSMLQRCSTLLAVRGKHTLN